MPSLPAWAACAVRTTAPVGDSVSTSGVSMLTTTRLPCASMAMPLGRVSGAPCTTMLASPCGGMRQTCHDAASAAVAPPVTVP